MAEHNKQPGAADFAFAMASLIGGCINEIQAIIGNPMSTFENRKDNFPKLVILKWIPDGIEILIAFTEEGVNYKLYEPENILDFPMPYQEKLAKIKDAMAKFGFKKNEGDVN